MDEKIDSIREGLRVCSEWKSDGHGDARKDCARCPYRNPDDPAGMNCGEHLMREAGALIDGFRAGLANVEDAMRKMCRDIAEKGETE